MKQEEKDARLTIRLTKDLHAKFKGHAALQGQSINDAAEQLIRDLVEKAERKLKK